MVAWDDQSVIELVYISVRTPYFLQEMNVFDLRELLMID